MCSTNRGTGFSSVERFNTRFGGISVMRRLSNSFGEYDGIGYFWTVGLNLCMILY